MAGFIRAFPPRLLFPRPVITEIALQPFSETTKKAIFFPTPLNSNAELLRNTTWPRWWSDNQSDLCLANYFQSKVCQWKTCVWQASKSLYTVIRPLYLHLHLTSVFRSTGFKTAALQKCYWIHVTRTSIELGLYNKCQKINQSGPFGYFLFKIILTISYLKRHYYSTIPWGLCFQQIEVFSGIPTAYFSCKYFPIYTRELLGCSLGISLSCGGKRSTWFLISVPFLSLNMFSRASTDSVTCRPCKSRVFSSEYLFLKRFASFQNEESVMEIVSDVKFVKTCDQESANAIIK